MEGMRHGLDLTFSLGMSVTKSGKTARVHWMSPAFKAGLTSGETILAVNDMDYTSERLRHAITDAQKDPKQTIRLVVKSGEHINTVSIPYHEGLRYPHLERIDGTTDYLSAIYTPR